MHIVTHDGVPIGVIGPHRLLVLARPRKRWSGATREAWRTLRRWAQPAGVEVGPPSEPPEGVRPRAWAESVLAHAVMPDRWEPPKYRPRSAAEDGLWVPPLRPVDPEAPEVPHPLYEVYPKRRPAWTWSAHTPRHDGTSRMLVRMDGALATIDCGRWVQPLPRVE